MVLTDDIRLRLLVCGGRDYTDFAEMCAALRAWTTLFGLPAVIIHGDARGADRLAGAWARHHGVPVETFKPDYKRFGPKYAPIERNMRMIRDGKPDASVAFPGERGTADMVRQLNEARIPVLLGALAT